MPAITIRGLDEQTVRGLKIRAAGEGRSMEAEVRSILTAAVAKREDTHGFGTKLAAVLSGSGPVPVPPRDEFPEPLDLP